MKSTPRHPQRISSSFLLAVMLVFPWTAGGKAEESSTEPETSYWKERFSLHGFISLGYGDLDPSAPGLRTGDEAILGIEEDGSFPYGNAALHLRFDPTNRRHSFILQLAVSDLGDSPVDNVGGEIELDWLLYQLQIAPNTRLRLGRQPVAAGIFNEVRDVGVVLPFFRPSFTFYREGSFFSETIDGVGISHRFWPESSWSLEADAYYGEFDVLEQGVGVNQTVSEVEATDAVGGQLWLSTPHPGIRLGLGALQWDIGEESAFSRDPATWKSWYASLEIELDHFVARAELRNAEVDLIHNDTGLPLLADLDFYYWQLGWLPTDKLGLYVQPEYFDVFQLSELFVDGSSSFRDRRDLGYGVRYGFRPDLVLKAEYHAVESQVALANQIVPGPSGFKIRQIRETLESAYFILSLSASF